MSITPLPARRYLSPTLLAERWSITPKTLANWRHLGTGPTFTKIGGMVRYPISDVEAYEVVGRTEAVA
ncbi:helix-turn-helix transcriptional regulator [Aeromicrobium alkaliterrae]|uniref:Helix-turn-helix domain-containing protein n=1 Tax=Aeromicrobium alkaliterrae TaxID=302168 RepID=A0ABP4WEL6_9ACTN